MLNSIEIKEMANGKFDVCIILHVLCNRFLLTKKKYSI